MLGTSDIPLSEWWPLSERVMHAGKQFPFQRKELISQTTDSAYLMVIHPPVSIWPRRKERAVRGMWQVHTFHSSMEKHKALEPHVRCHRKPLFILKQKQTLTTVHTKTHTPTFLRLQTEHYCSWLQPLRGKASTQVTLLHVSVKTLLFLDNYSSIPHYWPLFLSCWVKCGWAYFGLAKLSGCYVAWPVGELCITLSDSRTSY